MFAFIEMYYFLQFMDEMKVATKNFENSKASGVKGMLPSYTLVHCFREIWHII